MAGLAGTDYTGVGIIPVEHPRLPEHLDRSPRGCKPQDRGNIPGRAWCCQGLEPGARDKPHSGTHTTKEESVLGAALVVFLNPNPKVPVRPGLC